MKLMSFATKTYLLEAPIEILHEESLEWLDAIEFWKDEVAFFYKLIMEKDREDILKFQAKDVDSIEKHLIQISVEKLDALKGEVQEHEKFLTKMMEDPKLDEQLYRARHKQLATKFHDFESEFKLMKMKIFQMVKSLNKPTRF
ncbi:MAG TPA: hypothetical protein VGC65_11055 [Bacteroidia bacterium]|jgi:hypothetical protein